MIPLTGFSLLFYQNAALIIEEQLEADSSVFEVAVDPPLQEINEAYNLLNILRLQVKEIETIPLALNEMIANANRKNIAISADSKNRIALLQSQIEQRRVAANLVITSLYQQLGNQSISGLAAQVLVREQIKLLDALTNDRILLENRLRSNLAYMNFLIDNVDTSIDSKISSLTQCKSAGNLDMRPKEKQFFCDELPLGMSDLGISYKEYLKDYSKYNSEILNSLPLTLAQRSLLASSFSGPLSESVYYSYRPEWKTSKTYFKSNSHYRDW